MEKKQVNCLQFAIVNKGLLEIGNIGSGVGVILFSTSRKTAAGLHILAPVAGSRAPINPVMYADTAIPFIIEVLKKKGVNPPFSVAIAGGSVMMGQKNGSDVGNMVTDAVRSALKKAGLAPKIDTTGGAVIRQMVLNIDAGKIKVTS